MRCETADMRALLLLLALPMTAVAQPAEQPPVGQRFKLTDGQLFVPSGYKPAADGIELILHLHGGTAAEKSLVRSGRSAVIVCVAIPGLSKVYTDRFQSPATFVRILDEAKAQLKESRVSADPEFRRVIVSSFSAGFGGVREMLKDPATYDRIDALVMADSIYAGYTGDPAKRQIDPKLMGGFVNFAKDAAAGKKWFVLSHCDLQPGTYASTAETADFLIGALGGKREPASGPWPAEGLTMKSRFRKGQFSVYGFAGDQGTDHMRHLHGLWALLNLVSAK
jgi:hypothetical protein